MKFMVFFVAHYTMNDYWHVPTTDSWSIVIEKD